MHIVSDKSDLREVLGVVSDDIVHISRDHAGGQKIACGIEMTAEIEIAAVFGILHGRVLCHIHDIGKVKQLRNFIKQRRMLVNNAVMCLVSRVQHRHQEKPCLRLHGEQTLNDLCIPAGKCFGVVLCVVRKTDIIRRAERHLPSEQIVDTERNDIALAELVGVPEVIGFGKRLHVFLCCHAAAREIVGFCADETCEVLSPRILIHIVPAGIALRIARLEFTGGKAVADAADGAENAGKAAVSGNVVKGLFAGNCVILCNVHGGVLSVVDFSV